MLRPPPRRGLAKVPLAPHNCAMATASIDDAMATLFTTLGFSFVFCVALLALWHKLIAPAIPAYSTRSYEDHVFLASSFVSCYPAVTAPFLAAAALLDVPIFDNAVVMDARPSNEALHAVGISIGYMLYDTCYMLQHGQVRSPLMMGHHIVSILVWPYAVLRGRALIIVLFFIITEVTNIGQHGRMILLRLGLKHTKLYMVVGISWIALFFIVRIVPGPYALYKLAYGNYASYNTFDYVLMWLTCPLPFLLNSYWFYLLVRGLIDFLKKKDAASKGASSKAH